MLTDEPRLSIHTLTHTSTQKAHAHANIRFFNIIHTVIWQGRERNTTEIRLAQLCCHRSDTLCSILSHTKTTTTTAPATATATAMPTKSTKQKDRVSEGKGKRKGYRRKIIQHQQQQR